MIVIDETHVYLKNKNTKKTLKDPKTITDGRASSIQQPRHHLRESDD